MALILAYYFLLVAFNKSFSIYFFLINYNFLEDPGEIAIV